LLQLRTQFAHYGGVLSGALSQPPAPFCARPGRCLTPHERLAVKRDAPGPSICSTSLLPEGFSRRLSRLPG
jgi:hypothetical protein